MSATPTAQPIRVALVEDDPPLRSAFAALLAKAPGIQCVASFASAEEAIAGLGHAAPDVVLTDINLPGQSGIECVRQLKQRHPAIQFLMLTVYEDVDLIFRSLQAGATGYLLKRSVPTELVHAILDLHSGGAPMSSSIARKVVESFAPNPAARPPQISLTPREREIVEALAEGCQYKEIADRHRISLSTVRTHLQHIYGKLQVNNRTEAVVRFLGH